MGKLDSRYGALFGDEASYWLEGLNVRLLPDAAVKRADSSFRADCGRLNHNKPGAANGTAAKMHKMPGVGQSIMTKILAHGGNKDTITKSDGSQCERGKENAHGITPLLVRYELGIPAKKASRTAAKAA